MTANKDFKRLIRRRMAKTGESYTAARAHLLHKRATTPAAAVPAVAPPHYARRAGMSDEAVEAKTGCTWERWVHALDRAGAATWPHRAIAEYVHEKFDVPGWWAQTVTVGYERIRGLRDIGQRRDGAYEASKSRTIAAPLDRLYRAFSDARARATWLPGARVTVRTAQPGKSIRMTWEDGTSVEAYFTAKGHGKSQVAVQHRRLPSREAARDRKQFWDERLGALAERLTARRGRAATPKR
jgi:uncharacterized protein YndB with AHSA1/START domain